jgi:hypothetical protein
MQRHRQTTSMPLLPTTHELKHSCLGNLISQSNLARGKTDLPSCFMNTLFQSNNSTLHNRLPNTIHVFDCATHLPGVCHWFKSPHTRASCKKISCNLSHNLFGQRRPPLQHYTTNTSTRPNIYSITCAHVTVSCCCISHKAGLLPWAVAT